MTAPESRRGPSVWISLWLTAAAAAQSLAPVPASSPAGLPIDHVALAALRAAIGPAAAQADSPHFVLLSTAQPERSAGLLDQLESLYRAHLDWARELRLTPERPPSKLAILYFRNADELARGLAALDLREPAPLGGFIPARNCATFFELETYEPLVELRRRVEKTDPPQRDALRTRLDERLAGLHATLVRHEAAHLIQANLGLLGDAGRAPAWLAEGLATLFEPPVPPDAPVAAVNAYRLHEFRTLYRTVADLGDVPALLTRDDAWRGAGQYPLAWAVVRHLYAEQRAALAGLLRAVAAGSGPAEPEKRRAWLESHLGPLDERWIARLFETTNALAGSGL